MTSHPIGVLHSLAALMVLLFPAIAAAANAPADPWSRVPAAPTACYSSQDTHMDKSNAVFHALEEEIRQVSDANSNAQQEESENQETDPFKMAAAMQNAMASDPAKVQAMMKASAPDAVHQDVETMNQYATEREAMRQELDTLHERYKAATAKSLAPNDAKFDTLVKKVESQGGSFGGGEGSDVPDWAMAEWAVILKEKNAIYVGTICPQWFGPTGQYTAWLKRYKDHYVQKELPAKAAFAARSNQALALAGRSTGTSADTLEAVKDYVDEASRVFQQRWRGPYGIWPEGAMMKDLKGQAP
jgi:hypothetical protein